MDIAQLITELKAEALLAVSGVNLPLGVEQRLRAVFDNAVKALDDTDTRYLSDLDKAKAAGAKEQEEDGA